MPTNIDLSNTVVMHQNEWKNHERLVNRFGVDAGGTHFSVYKINSKNQTLDLMYDPKFIIRDIPTDAVTRTDI